MFTWSLCFFISIGFSQDFKFEVSVSSDTILMGNHFELTFAVENASRGNFEGPKFENFDLVGGPNYSSSMTILNGEMSQSTSYTYYLKPKHAGSYDLGPAYFNTEKEDITSPIITVYVKENPDGIQQDPNGLSPRSSSDSKRLNKEKENKLKKYKMKKL